MAPPPLLPGYVSIHNILDGRIRPNSMVNVVGVIVDYRAPVPTRGSDWKCQLRIYDSSVEQDSESSICLNIFRPSNEMPKAGCGDVILIRSAKVQKYQMDMPSLITNWKTTISLYQASKIPKPPANASVALHPPIKSKDRLPDANENAFVSQVYHSIDKDRLPTEVEFESMVLTSTNVKDKFTLLEKVKDGMFCDIVVQVVKPPYDMGDKVTLWVADYTQNDSFYQFSYTPGDLPGGRDGDPYGYTEKFMDTSSTPSSSNWTGPFGKRCIQVTCWEPHATVIRETKIEVGQWVSIRNVQIKMGRNDANLEGFLREDRGANGPKLNIHPLTLDDPENINPHMKDALRRKRDYERLKKSQIKDMAEAGKAGKKRKSVLSTDSEPKKKNSKTRRRAERAKAHQSQKKDEQPVEVSDLNSRVKCENMDKPTSFVAEMTEPVYHQTTIDGQDVKLQLPFINTNYRSNVRVVNFFPSNIVDFARPKKETEFDILSDDGEESLSGSGSEEEENADQNTLDDFAIKRNWEWRFYLELEDAAVPEKKSKQRMWVAVDNQAAQCLLNLDASNLRHESKDLQMLRDRLFTLWGELEERKSLAQTKKREAQEAARKGKPPSDSDEEDEQPHKTKNSDKAPVSSRPFSCCIRQYGVKVLESDPGKADAGKGKRWQRMYNLFGTRISG